MRTTTRTLGLIVSFAAVVILAVPAQANGTSHHPRHVSKTVHVKVRAPYRHYVPEYVYYVPTRVYRCYPARQMIEDQVGFVAGYAPLPFCG
jgi:hypothetical protein